MKIPCYAWCWEQSRQRPTLVVPVQFDSREAALAACKNLPAHAVVNILGEILDVAGFDKTRLVSLKREIVQHMASLGVAVAAKGPEVSAATPPAPPSQPRREPPAPPPKVSARKLDDESYAPRIEPPARAPELTQHRTAPAPTAAPPAAPPTAAPPPPKFDVIDERALEPDETPEQFGDLVLERLERAAPLVALSIDADAGEVQCLAELVRRHGGVKGACTALRAPLARSLSPADELLLGVARTLGGPDRAVKVLKAAGRVAGGRS